jgi:class 3 adenylate cyclase
MKRTAGSRLTRHWHRAGEPLDVLPEGVTIASVARALPSGTVTFLFTDIEDSTRLWERDRPGMSAAMKRHDELLRDAIANHGGAQFASGCDGVAGAFARAADAVHAAVAVQRSWPSRTGLCRCGCGWGCTVAKRKSATATISGRR